MHTGLNKTFIFNYNISLIFRRMDELAYIIHLERMPDLSSRSPKQDPEGRVGTGTGSAVGVCFL